MLERVAGIFRARGEGETVRLGEEKKNSEEGEAEVIGGNGENKRE